jgi:hypothetical protein
VVAPPSAPGGSSLEATVRLTSTTGGAVDLTTGLPVLLVVRDGEVVHRPDASSDVGQVWRLSAAPVAHATAVSLVGCPEPQTGAVGRAPDPLPAGDYQLLAVLEAVGPGGSIERLVSAPAPLRIEG